MSIFKSNQIGCIALSLVLGIISSAYAAVPQFFLSNNTQILDAKAALGRLNSAAQRQLQDSTIEILQRNHTEQGKFANILGHYTMANQLKSTTENGEIFYASPLQKFSKQQIITVATQLSERFRQESVAVFIPSNQPPIGDVLVILASPEGNITDTIQVIRKRLPSSYSHAFSLHLKNLHSGFNQVKVCKIEWLGSKLNLAILKKAFPKAKIISHYGKAYLIYRNGQTKLL